MLECQQNYYRFASRFLQHFVYNMKFFPTGGPPLATIKCVIATAVATSGAAMGSAVATGGLPWVVSTGTSVGQRRDTPTPPLPSKFGSCCLFNQRTNLAFHIKTEVIQKG